MKLPTVGLRIKFFIVGLLLLKGSLFQGFNVKTINYSPTDHPPDLAIYLKEMKELESLEVENMNKIIIIVWRQLLCGLFAKNLEPENSSPYSQR
jgi:hypothetical protein